METKGKSVFSRWMFAVLALAGVLASGIFIGVMSTEGLSAMRLLQAVGFGIFGLLMFWGALSTQS